MTITYPAGAIGMAQAAARAGVPAAISFTTETDGRLPDGTSLDGTRLPVSRITQRPPMGLWPG